MAEVEIEVENSESWKAKGNDFYKTKSYQSAIEAYTKAIVLDSDNSLLYNNRAAAYLMLLQFKEAITDCDKAVSLDATNSKAFFRKATALKGMGKLDEAMATVTQGLMIDPTNAAAMQDKNLIERCRDKILQVKDLYRAQQLTGALVGIEQLLKDLGTNIRELNILKVKILLGLKKTEEAYNMCNSLMRTAANNDSELLGLRSQCLFHMGEIENALKHLQQAVRSDPDNTELRTQYRLIRDIDEKKNQGDEHFKSGNYVEAIHAWSACITITKDSPVFLSKLYLNRATALFKQKKHDDVVKDCTKAIYYNHNYVKAYIRRSESYLGLGGPENIQRAISDLETSIELENDEEVQESYKEKLKKAKVALKRSKRKDLYAILGVSQSASESDIKSAYKKAALKYHPDKQASKTEEQKKEAEAMFKTIGEAYEVLSNPEKKERYDSGVELEDLENPHAGCGGHGGFGGGGGIDPNILFQMFMQQQAGGRGGFSF